MEITHNQTIFYLKNACGPYFWSKLNFHYDKGTWAMAHGLSGGLIQKVGYHEILWAIIRLIRLVQTNP
jgi:hypothetical protein